MTTYDSLARPSPFQRGAVNFWNEPHISKQLLKAHLDPGFEGASRTPDFIDRSVNWIFGIAPPDQYPKILDVGCGPGLYSERLHDRGYHVTGIDFSSRSIDYARGQAEQAGRAIEYDYGNYLDMTYSDAFDFAILIYCDYGALSPEEGSRLLGLIHGSLRKGGKLLVDVFTTAKMAGFQEKRHWSYHEDGGFWSPDSHFTIQADCIYGAHTTLEQTVVVSQDSVQPYYIWHRYFDQERLTGELKTAGFHMPLVFGDVAGAPCSPQSETMAIISEKR